MECQKIIVDCDAGTDDALALILLIAAHKQKKIEILAITCVTGNTYVDNVVNNVFRTLRVCDALDIPVHKGADSALLSTESARIVVRHGFHHGSDGFGDVYTDKPDISKLKEEHAVCALHRITAKYPGEVTVLGLGPLTNVAIAVRMYPDFAKNVKKFLVMGGNLCALAGSLSSQVDFNFFADPESVHIVMNFAAKKMWLLPLGTCMRSNITHEWRDNVFGKIDTPVVELINTIDSGKYKTSKKRTLNYRPCDALLAGVLLRPDIAKDLALHHVDIELNGLKTRGQVVIDDLASNEPNVHIIQDLDFETFKDLLIYAANPNTENSRVLL
ncbi:inosine-uridine preferring nucleoside hydrolase isoform X2 [Nasonia vitripennis]|nr:inosine-uridine preferring nucleoside hydrolase isoform X2 [Nasonia vitripennis]